MAVDPETPPRGPAGRVAANYWRKLEPAVLVIAALVGGLFGMVVLHALPQERHQHELRRIERWVSTARAFPPPGVDRQVWHECMTSVHNSLYNPLSRPQYVPTEKLRELADQLDATQGAALATFGNLLGLIEYLEEICPPAKDYGPYDQVRQTVQELRLESKPVKLVIIRK